jgi:hypothetical protein
VHIKNKRRHAYAWKAAAAFAVFLSFGSANAATFSIQGGSDVTLSGFNPNGSVPGILANGTHVTAFSGSFLNQGLYVAPQNVQLTFTFLGKEAGDFNASFAFQGGTLLLNTDAAGTSATATYNVGGNPGVVPFVFSDITDGALSHAIVNGLGGGSGTSIAFFIDPSDSSVAYALFDDSNSNGSSDLDFDDMVVRIKATSIGGEAPLPGALPLFVSGLGALSMVGWRRKRKAAT